MIDSQGRLASLKTAMARIEGRCDKQIGPGATPLGHRAIDALTGGGIAPARLHEAFAASSADASSAAGFAAMLARQRGGAMLWVRQERRDREGGALHATGLAEIGLDPAAVLLCVAADADAVLKAANEAARCPQVATLVVELWGRAAPLTLTASRRLALSAEASGATIIMLRIDAAPEPSAATTRWRIASAPSPVLPGNAPGATTIDLALLRQRGRAGEGQWRVVWNREQARFDPASTSAAADTGERAAVSGAPRAVPVGRPVAREAGGEGGDGGERRVA